MSQTEAAWRYEIKYGPEGEANYAWVYRGKEMICVAKTHHAKAIVDAALALAQSSQAIGVKGLGWGTMRETESGNIAQDAECSIGHYIATTGGWFLMGQTSWMKAGDLPSAKAAAQQDYEQRIRSALTPLQPVDLAHQSVSAGWVLVPIEPTREMSRILGSARTFGTEGNGEIFPQNLWRELLATLNAEVRK